MFFIMFFLYPQVKTINIYFIAGIVFYSKFSFPINQEIITMIRIDNWNQI